MYPLLLVFIWRRKLLLVPTSILVLFGVWLWTVHDARNIRGDRIFLIGNIRYMNRAADGPAEQKGDFAGNARGGERLESVQAVRTTVRRSQSGSIEARQHFSPLSALLSNKDAAKVLQNAERHAHDADARSRKAARAVQLSGKSMRYNHELQKMGVPIVSGLRYHESKYAPAQRLVHLDLKGAPPKISYLKRLFPMLKSLGATGLLIEYEDMFPFERPIQQISAKNCYSRADIRELLRAATASGLSVIPLIQTFGHMEFVLKQPGYAHLREVPGLPQSLCPSNNDSLAFLQTMIGQVIDTHNQFFHTESDLFAANRSRITHIHIGCDEVFQLAECARCQSKQRNALFLGHVKWLAAFIRSRWPRTKLIVWDDMLRQIPMAELHSSGLGDLVEPMVWAYAENVQHYVSSQVFAKYSRIFATIWTASAFKGAFGEQLVVPPLKRHLENTLNWLSLMRTQGVYFAGGIQGIALTGWQRYDHFATLCELLPVAIPSLALCLVTASKGYFEPDLRQNHVLSALTCPEPSQRFSVHHPWLNLNHDSSSSAFGKCMFAGSPVLRFAGHLVEVTMESRRYLDDVRFKGGWLTPYQMRQNFSSPARVGELIEEAARLRNTLLALVNDGKDAMLEVYDEWTTKEFAEQAIEPLIADLQRLQRQAEKLMTINTWPRRPL